MAKQKRKDAEAAAREKLADAQAKLAASQERRRRVATQGEQEVEQVRQKAAARLNKATQEVERRAAKVARAEGKLLSLQARNAPKDASPPPPVPVVEIDEPQSVSPAAAADRLEEVAAAARPESAILIDASSDTSAADNASAEGEQAIGRNERRLLVALREQFDSNGATFSQWLEASNLSKRTFLRARKVLVEGGLVEHNGSGPGAHYALTASGRSHAELPQ